VIKWEDVNERRKKWEEKERETKIKLFPFIVQITKKGGGCGV
jgi:hypothetical protein